MVEVATGQTSSASSEPAVVDGPDETGLPIASDRRRFCISLAIGAAVILVPYLWVLTDMWNRRPSLFRTVISDHQFSNFYEFQGRALLAGHLYVPNGSLGGKRSSMADTNTCTSVSFPR